jgi:hypothetical protein
MEHLLGPLEEMRERVAHSERRPQHRSSVSTTRRVGARDLASVERICESCAARSPTKDRAGRIHLWWCERR